MHTVIRIFAVLGALWTLVGLLIMGYLSLCFRHSLHARDAAERSAYGGKTFSEWYRDLK